MNTAGSINSAWQCIICPTNRDNGDVSGITFESFAANPYSTKCKQFGPYFGDNTAKQSMSMTTAAITGKKSPVHEDNYSGELTAFPTNGDPVNQWYFNVFIKDVFNVSYDNNVRINVKVTYNVMLYDRRQQDLDPYQGLDDLDEESKENDIDPPIPP